MPSISRTKNNKTKMSLRKVIRFITFFAFLLPFSQSYIPSECIQHRYLQDDSFVEFDPSLLESLLLTSNLDQLNDDLQIRLYSGDTSSLRDILNSTRAYLETIPLTNDLLNGLSPEEQTDQDRDLSHWNEEEILRVLHWIYYFETFSDWVKEQSDVDDILNWIDYNNDHLENFCNLVLIPSSETNEFEQALGADTSSCLKTILTDFQYVKYLGVREAYKKMLRSDGFAVDLTTDITTNIYEAVFDDYISGDGREVNAMLGDRLIAMYRDLPIFAGRECNSSQCKKTVDDEAVCLASVDQDPRHVEERNCTVSQEYVDRYIEWNMNFVTAGSLKLQDSVIAMLLFPALHGDPASFFFERVQSLYITVVVGITRVILSPWKRRNYFPMEKVNNHAEFVLETWMMSDPNLTSWNQIDESLPSNGVSPKEDPLNARVGDWMSYLTELYPPGESASIVFQFLSFVRTRLLLGVFVSPDAV